MSYIGREPVIGNFVKLDTINVVNGQASYTMQNGGANFTAYETVNQFLVSLNGILQSPTTSFTVSSSTITFASNLVTGDVIDFIIVLGNTLDIGTPSDNTVSLAKLTATGTKDATTFLRGDNTFASAGGTNTPAFLSYANADQLSIPANTYTKLTNYGAEIFDTDNTFSSSRFTPGVAGKYFIFGTAYLLHYGAQRSWIAIYKNGSLATACADMPNSSDSYPIQVTGIVDMPNTTDYVEIFVRQSGTGTEAYSSGASVTFGGYKIIE